MSSLQERSDEVQKAFLAQTDWEARYKLLIDWGRHLPAFPEEFRLEANKVRGCQSQVWLNAALNEDGTLDLQADSDALIVKGLIAVLMRVYGGARPAEILNFPPEFLKTLGFEGNLSPSRANGLHAMLKQIRNYALVFDHLWKQKK